MNNKFASEQKCRELLTKCSNGSQFAKQELLVSLNFLIKNVISKETARLNGNSGYHLDKQEIYSKACLCLFNYIIPNYKPQKGRFFSYFLNCTHHSVLKEIEKQIQNGSRQIDIGGYLNNKLSGNKFNGSDNAENELEEHPCPMDNVYFDENAGQKRAHEEIGYNEIEIGCEIGLLSQKCAVAADALRMKLSGDCTTVRELAKKLRVSKTSAQIELKKALEYFRKIYECNITK